jgi:CBS domain containing-hemolysin-like protein
MLIILTIIPILYLLTTLAEDAVVLAKQSEYTPLSTDSFKANNRDVRSYMASMLLARIFLKYLFAILAGTYLVNQHFLSRLPFPKYFSPHLASLLSALLLALPIAGLFFLLKKIPLKATIQKNPLRVLRQLYPILKFWNHTLKPFTITPRHEEPAALPIQQATISATAREKRELELLKSIVEFSDTTLKQIVQPRASVVGADSALPFPQLLELIQSAEFSRFPVYTEDLDNTWGILYVKDLLPHIQKDASFNWNQLVTKHLLVAPESKKCTELLREFKREKLHMAIVVDEYGSCSGIVTMEDILEEITGEIRDEFDNEHEVRFKKIDHKTFLFQGQVLLNDVCRICHLEAGTFDAVRGNTDTLAGLILSIRGDIPPVGATVSHEGFVLTVTAATKRKLDQIKLTLP